MLSQELIYSFTFNQPRNASLYCGLVLKDSFIVVVVGGAGPSAKEDSQLSAMLERSVDVILHSNPENSEYKFDEIESFSMPGKIDNTDVQLNLKSGKTVTMIMPNEMRCDIVFKQLQNHLGQKVKFEREPMNILRQVLPHIMAAIFFLAGGIWSHCALQNPKEQSILFEMKEHFGRSGIPIFSFLFGMVFLLYSVKIFMKRNK